MCKLCQKTKIYFQISQNAIALNNQQLKRMRRKQTVEVKHWKCRPTNEGNPPVLQHSYKRWIWTQINDVWDFVNIKDIYHRMYIVFLVVSFAACWSPDREHFVFIALHYVWDQQAEVGRVLKNCTQVKVKVIVWIVTWVRVKKYRIKKLLK